MFLVRCTVVAEKKIEATTAYLQNNQVVIH